MPQTIEVDGRPIELPEDPEQAALVIENINQQVLANSRRSLAARTGGSNFAAGINEGMANMVGLPVDAVNAGFRGINAGLDAAGVPEGVRIPVSDAPVLGSESIKQDLENVGVMARTNPEPPTATDRFLGNLGQDTGPALLTLPFAPGVALLKQGVSAGRRKLAQLLATEAAVVTGSAGGRTIAQEVDAGPLVETAADIAGAMGSGGMVRSAQKNFGKLDPKTAQDQAAQVMQEAASDPQQAFRDLQEGNKVLEELPAGFAPPTAALTNDVGLAELDRGVRVGGAGRDAKVAMGQEQLRQRDILSQALDDLDARDATSPPTPRQTSTERSVEVRGSLDAERSAFEKRANHLYAPSTIDPDGVIGFRTSLLKDAALEARKKQGTLAGSAGQFPEDRVKRFEESAEVLSFQELTDTRKTLNAEIKSARTAGRYEEADILQGLKSAVDDTIEDLAEGGQGTLVRQGRGVNREYVNGAVQRFQEANYFYRDNVGKFKRGLAEDATGTRPNETLKTQPEKTVRKFLNNGGEGVRALFNALNGNAQGVEAVKQFMTAEMAEAAIDAQGRFSQSRLFNYLRQNPEQLDAIILNPTGVKVGISSKENAERLMGLLEQFPERRAQFKRSLWDNMEETVFDGDAVKPGALKGFLKKNKAALEAVYGDDPGQLQRIRGISYAFDLLQKPDDLAKFIPGSQTQPNADAFENAQNLIKLAAQVSPSANVLSRAMGGLRQLLGEDAAVAVLVQRALTDPDLAEALLSREVTPREIQAITDAANVAVNQLTRTAPADLAPLLEGGP